MLQRLISDDSTPAPSFLQFLLAVKLKWTGIICNDDCCNFHYESNLLSSNLVSILCIKMNDCLWLQFPLWYSPSGLASVNLEICISET